MNNTENANPDFFLLLASSLAGTAFFQLHAFRTLHRQQLVAPSHALAGTLKRFAEAGLQRGQGLAELTEVGDSCRQLVEGNPGFAYCLIENDRGTLLFASEPVPATDQADHIVRLVVGYGPLRYPSPWNGS